MAPHALGFSQASWASVAAASSPSSSSAFVLGGTPGAAGPLGDPAPRQLPAPPRWVLGSGRSVVHAGEVSAAPSSLSWALAGIASAAAAAAAGATAVSEAMASFRRQAAAKRGALHRRRRGRRAEHALAVGGVGAGSRLVALRATQGDEIKFMKADGDGVAALPPLSLEERARALAESLPSLAHLSGKVVVIKYGGAAMVASPERTIRDVASLRALGLRPVLVHGGGPEINSWLAKVGIEPKFVNGLRVTDADTMEVVGMVLMGKVNKKIVATMGAAGVAAVGLGGVDGGLFKAKKVDNEALGFVGEVTGVDAAPLEAALGAGLVPVVATCAADNEGNLLNINADTAASALAGALGADEFILMTDVPGILRSIKDPASLIASVNEEQAEQLITDGVVAGGMIPKVRCCLSALQNGVPAAHIIDGRRRHSLLEELLGTAETKRGTTIYRESAAESRA